ncbi:DUF3592 domain-containing protein [Kitasatospora sp. NPDC056531]|uniref:DUF3592 domain-containing protein n=1 Tax=Kitasatospora sp. NPDC056531 TaxID=3345856 RepID=UPI0036B954E8
MVRKALAALCLWVVLVALLGLAFWGYDYAANHAPALATAGALGATAVGAAVMIVRELPLYRRGVPAPGTVVSVSSRTSRGSMGVANTSHTATVRFRTPDGVQRTALCSCKRETKPGEPCVVYYDPTEPSRAGTRASLGALVGLAAFCAVTMAAALWCLVVFDRL